MQSNKRVTEKANISEGNAESIFFNAPCGISRNFICLFLWEQTAEALVINEDGI